MAMRARPEGCCRPRSVPALPARKRERLVRAFKALADPTRLEILRLVAGQTGPTCVCDIVDHFDLSQPTISHHLKILREAQLLKTSRVGIWAFYSIDPSGLALFEDTGSLLGST